MYRGKILLLNLLIVKSIIFLVATECSHGIMLLIFRITYSSHLHNFYFTQRFREGNLYILNYYCI